MTSTNTEKSRISKYPSPITLRLSQNEIDRLDKMVSGASRSAYIRKQIFGENVDKRKYRPKTPKTDDVAISQILAMLGASRIGNNLNQLAKAANSGLLRLKKPMLSIWQFGPCLWRLWGLKPNLKISNHLTHDLERLTTFWRCAIGTSLDEYSR